MSSSNVKTNMMMLGPPGAGKGTQAQRLAEELNVPQVSTGDMLRSARRKGTSLGKEAAEYMDRGDLVPDEVVIGIVAERLKEDDAQDGFILDGFPRTTAQAEALFEMGIELDAVLDIVVKEEEVLRRLSGRLSCPNCGAVYHRVSNPPEVVDTCDQCGHKGLVIREDDRPEAVRERLAAYSAKTRPLEEYYRERDLLIEIDGQGEPDNVFSRIRDGIGLK